MQLFSMLDDKGDGVEILLDASGAVIVSVRNGPKGVAKRTAPFVLRDRWQSLGIVHRYARFKDSELVISINGIVRARYPLQYPVCKDSFTTVLFGSPQPRALAKGQVEMTSCYRGQMSCSFAFAEPLSDEQLTRLHWLGAARPLYPALIRTLCACGVQLWLAAPPALL